MPSLPSRPHDHRYHSGRGSLFAGRQRHIMIHPTRLQIALAKNSKPPSQRDRLVARSSEPFAVSRESNILPCVATLKSSCRAPPNSLSTFTYSSPSLQCLRLTNQNPYLTHLAAV